MLRPRAHNQAPRLLVMLPRPRLVIIVSTFSSARTRLFSTTTNTPHHFNASEWLSEVFAACVRTVWDRLDLALTFVALSDVLLSFFGPPEGGFLLVAVRGTKVTNVII